MGPDGGEAFAHAIMTTDTVDKRATADGGGYRVGGCAKGVGMIGPRLATMLAFVTTDAPVAAAGPASARVRAARRAVRPAHGRRMHVHERHGPAPRERGRRRGARCARDARVGRLSRGRGRGRRVADAPARRRRGGRAARAADRGFRRSHRGGCAGRGEGRGGLAPREDRRVRGRSEPGPDPAGGRVLGCRRGSCGDRRRDRRGARRSSRRDPARRTSPTTGSAAQARAADGRARRSRSVSSWATVRVAAAPMGCDLSYEYVRINGEYTT